MGAGNSKRRQIAEEERQMNMKIRRQEMEQRAAVQNDRREQIAHLRVAAFDSGLTEKERALAHERLRMLEQQQQAEIDAQRRENEQELKAKQAEEMRKALGAATSAATTITFWATRR